MVCVHPFDPVSTNQLPFFHAPIFFSQQNNAAFFELFEDKKKKVGLGTNKPVVVTCDAPSAN
jgi:hypothetical protein